MAERRSKSTEDVQSEGDYRAARAYKRDIETFVRTKDREIPRLAKKAEKALAGPEGAELKRAERKGKSKARH